MLAEISIIIITEGWIIILHVLSNPICQKFHRLFSSLSLASPKYLSPPAYPGNLRHSYLLLPLLLLSWQNRDRSPPPGSSAWQPFTTRTQIGCIYIHTGKYRLMPLTRWRHEVGPGCEEPQGQITHPCMFCANEEPPPIHRYEKKKKWARESLNVRDSREPLISMPRSEKVEEIEKLWRTKNKTKKLANTTDEWTCAGIALLL